MKLLSLVLLFAFILIAKCQDEEPVDEIALENEAESDLEEGEFEGIGASGAGK